MVISKNPQRKIRKSRRYQMKGIILAGGKGTRLYPLTQFISKQLLPVYEKPMIYYPLSTLMLGGIRDIAIVSTPRDLPQYRELLGDGSRWGLKFTYFEQDKPRGISHVFIVCKEFIGDEGVSLILGDNIFYGNMRLEEVYHDFTGGAMIFGYPVNDPERYGVIEFDNQGNVLGIEEKPAKPKSKYAIPGLYLYDNRVVEFAEGLKPSARGELEITDLNDEYLRRGELRVQILGRGVAWLDTGTGESLQEASAFIHAVEKRQSYKIGCPEEIALRMGFIDLDRFLKLIDEMPKCEYRNYLKDIRREMEAAGGKRQEAIHRLQP
jgi:glucose-1-phosphate thymidylyltransferase